MGNQEIKSRKEKEDSFDDVCKKPQKIHKLSCFET